MIEASGGSHTRRGRCVVIAFTVPEDQDVLVQHSPLVASGLLDNAFATHNACVAVCV